MSTITTLNDGITGASFRGQVNTNFANLNTDKAETSALTSGLATKQDTISGLTASGAELNILDGATLSTTELNYVDGVTSAIQTQIDGKQATLVSGTNIKTINGSSLLGSGNLTVSGGASALDDLTDVVILTPTTGQALVYDGAQWENTTLPGGGDALTTNPLSQFASTTSAQLAGVISDETGSGSLVFANSPTLVTPVLGTPISGTLANCTGLPLAGIVDINTNRILGRSTAGTGDIEELNVTAIPALIGLGTSDSPQFTGVNVGHATDTTISRVSAGVIAVEGETVPTISSTNTITNKRNTKRVVVITQAAAPAINTDNGDIFQITGLAQAITSFTTNLTGTPVAGDMMIIQITDSGTARAITWGASFAATTVALPTTTVISTMLRIGFQRNNANTVWDCIAVA